MPKASSEEGGLRELMETFLQERLAGKVEKLAKDDPKRDTLATQFEFETWVADAARRVSQLQVVTHSLKAIHPDARGTNLYVPPDSLSDHALLGSRALGEDFDEDVVGNAAALDVYKFLKLEFSGRSILLRALENDEALKLALSSDSERASAWMQAFAGITQPNSEATSHTYAKQLYWLVGDDPALDDHYHLLAPLYSTSLVHRVFMQINRDRFGEEAQVARNAKKAGEYSEFGYREYPNLAIQKLGGTKPQNISQLNSERGGANYLLASLPPNWKTRKVWWPRHTDSIFNRFFGRRRNVQQLVHGLANFLKSDPVSTVKTRHIRDEYVKDIVDELLLLSIELGQLDSGWTTDPECQLNDAEALWLDPHRSETDPEFAARRESDTWTGEVSQRFGNWLNSRLGKVLPVAAAENRHWQKLLGENLGVLQEVVRHG
ncbi:type I-F CRISPR-associated protein Csy1 [Microbulbifer sp.]|uniref:type I-F CRISPR-associated protein Csy1 n=1 Tax=Microbulbifer sp. TaxID=1908541 RepID=UPI002585E768|nr:type I-F CRISPR-associated protein Csy1 [Microbulbifer sp.]